MALARALAPEPGLVLLDEPFDALDAGLRAQVRGEVREALRAAGATALLVTHDQEEALSLADTVAVMRGGRIVQAADPQTLYRDPVDAEVAAFVGEAVLLEGRLEGDYAETPLGRLPIRGGADDGTRATVMLRPEQILCQGAGHAAGPAAPRGRVLSTSFYGHDATARIAMDGPGGREIVARAVGHLLPAAGERGRDRRRRDGARLPRRLRRWGHRAPRWPQAGRPARPAGGTARNGSCADADSGAKMTFVTRRRLSMPHGYDVLTGLLVAFIVIAMIGGAFGRSHP